MALLGDKAQAKEAMRAAGVPLVPGTEGTATLDEWRFAATELGYPLLLKAAAGGGGRACASSRAPEDLDRAYAAAAAEADAAFGDGTLYVERALVPARHVEIQVLADGDGDVLTLGERECSIQRRHQKLVEESPSPAFTAETRERWRRRRAGLQARRLRERRHVRVPARPGRQPYFIEVNCRLQVEHPSPS